MKKTLLLAGLLAVSFAAGPGCGSVTVDTMVEDPNANRVATGTVEVGEDVVLPPDALVAVRVVDVAHRGYQDRNAAALGKPNSPAGITLPPQVIAEVKIPHPQGHSVPFTVRFAATDAQMQGGLVLEARVSFGGKVRYFNVDSYAITPDNITRPRRIEVNGVR